MNKKYLLSILVVIVLFSSFAIIGQNNSFTPPLEPLQPIDWSPGPIESRLVDLSAEQLQIIDKASVVPSVGEGNLKLMIETFELLDQLACLSSDFDFYTKVNEKKYGCIVPLEVKQVNTNLDIIAQKSYKLIYSIGKNHGIDIAGWIEGVSSNIIDFGLSYLGINLKGSSGQSSEVVIEEKPEQLLESINQDLRDLIAFMSSFNAKYRGIAIRNLHREVERSKLYRNRNLLIETN